jgi:hypothetical protein
MPEDFVLNQRELATEPPNRDKMQPIGQRTVDRRLAVGVVFVAAF